MQDIDKPVESIFVRNIDKVELEQNLNIVNRYIISTSVRYNLQYSNWTGEIYIYIPLRITQTSSYMNLFSEDFSLNKFLREKNLILHCSQLDGTEYNIYHLSYSFFNLSEAMFLLEKIKNQFTSELDNLYSSNPEKLLVQPEKRVIDGFPVYAYATFMETVSDDIFVLKRYVFPTEKKVTEDESFNVCLRPFILSQSCVVGSNAYETINHKLSDGRVCSVLEVPGEVEKIVDLSALQTKYKEIINRDLDTIEEKYYVAKQKISKEYSLSSTHDFIVSKRKSISVKLTKNLCYNDNEDMWHMDVDIILPDMLIRRAHITDDAISSLFTSDVKALFDLDRYYYSLNNQKVKNLSVYTFTDKSEDTVTAICDNMVNKILSFIQDRLNEYQKVGENER